MHCVVVLRDLGDKGNIIAEAQLLSRRDKGCNHRAGGRWNCVGDDKGEDTNLVHSEARHHGHAIPG